MKNENENEKTNHTVCGSIIFEYQIRKKTNKNPFKNIDMKKMIPFCVSISK